MRTHTHNSHTNKTRRSCSQVRRTGGTLSCLAQWHRRRVRAAHGKVAATLLLLQGVPEGVCVCVLGGLVGGGALMQRDRFRSLTHCQDEYSGSENKTPGVGRRSEECVGRGWEDRGCWVTSEVLQPHRTNKYSVQKNKQKRKTCRKHAEGGTAETEAGGGEQSR